jgi:hypothetical protein
MSNHVYSDGFDELARRPEIWLNESRYQMVAADALFDHFEAIKLTGTIEERNGYYKAAMFHAGLAIENAAKAVLIKRDPNLIKNKRIDFKNLCGRTGHEILKCTESALGNLTTEEERVLIKLQQFVIWYGKYTLPKFGTVLDDHSLRQEMRIINLEDVTIVRELLKRLTAIVTS